MSNEHYAVVGNPISHSLSPQIHQLFAQQMAKELTYQKMQATALSFHAHVRSFFAEGGRGLNVTAPFKQNAYAIAEVVTKRCRQAQAANTLWVEQGKLNADITDGVGCARDLQRYRPITNKKILIVGAGGAVRGILAPLLEQNPQKITVATRHSDALALLQRDFSAIATSTYDALKPEFEIIINALPTSANHPHPLAHTIIQSAEFCYDLSYLSRGLTPFVNALQALGVRGCDGLGMLVEQAAESFFIWHGYYPSTDAVLAQLRQNQGR